MAAPKGHARYGGRQKGTLNKATADLFEICQKHKVNVFEGLIMLCKSADGSVRFSALKECAQYLYPKRKALEVSDPGGEPLGSKNSKALEELKALHQASANERKKSVVK